MLASFPGLPRLQFLIACSVQVIKNWSRGRPGDETNPCLEFIIPIEIERGNKRKELGTKLRNNAHLVSIVPSLFYCLVSFPFSRNFIPSPGHLHHLVTPQSSDVVRIDTGVRQGEREHTSQASRGGEGGRRVDPRGHVHVHNHSTHATPFLHMHVTCSLPNSHTHSHTLTGDEVSEYYDPMIAKLVVWGQDRTTALKQLTESLQRYQVDTHTYT